MSATLLNRMSSRLPLRNTGSVLIVASDEMTTRAAVCRGIKRQGEIAAFSESNRHDLGQALDELLPRLSEQKVSTPRRAALMSSHVHAAVL